MKLLSVTKEIWSKKGKLHFRRFAIIETPWFSVYVHEIFKSDEDLHCHDHPWDYASLILKGGYYEIGQRINRCCSGWLTIHNKNYFHQVKLIRPVVSLVITGPRRHFWGYSVDGRFVDHVTYRKLKNERQLF